MSSSIAIISEDNKRDAKKFDTGEEIRSEVGNNLKKDPHYTEKFQTFQAFIDNLGLFYK